MTGPVLPRRGLLRGLATLSAVGMGATVATPSTGTASGVMAQLFAKARALEDDVNSGANRPDLSQEQLDTLVSRIGDHERQAAAMIPTDAADALAALQWAAFEIEVEREAGVRTDAFIQALLANVGSFVRTLPVGGAS